MITLLKNLIDTIPLPMWMSNNHNPIFINNTFMSIFNITNCNIKDLSNYIRINLSSSKIDIPKKDFGIVPFNGIKYIHRVLNDIYLDNKIEIGVLLHEGSKNILDNSNSLNILETIINNVPN